MVNEYENQGKGFWKRKKKKRLKQICGTVQMNKKNTCLMEEFKKGTNQLLFVKNFFFQIEVIMVKKKRCYHPVSHGGLLPSFHLPPSAVTQGVVSPLLS